jgi:hypothetical protein
MKIGHKNVCYERLPLISASFSACTAAFQTGPDKWKALPPHPQQKAVSWYDTGPVNLSKYCEAGSDESRHIHNLLSQIVTAITIGDQVIIAHGVKSRAMVQGMNLYEVAHMLVRT